jgi:hypothetical protein
LALRYNGGTKQRPVSWLKYYQSGEMEWINSVYKINYFYLFF